jgi:hypothetical protein
MDPADRVDCKYRDCNARRYPVRRGAVMAMRMAYEGYASRHEETSLAAGFRRDRMADVILQRHRLHGPAAAERPA